MKKRYVNWLWILGFNLLGIGFFLVDRWMKILAQSSYGIELMKVASLQINFVFSKNANIAFGIPLPKILLYLIVSLILVILVYLLYKSYKAKELLYIFYITFIILGALSNLCDRIYYGSVIDYIEIIFWRYTWPIFNVADVMIVAGVTGWLLYDLKTRQEKNEKISKTIKM